MELGHQSCHGEFRGYLGSALRLTWETLDLRLALFAQEKRHTCILTTSDNITARCPIIWNMAASPLYQEYGLKYEKIRDLESIGLISIADYSHLFGTNDKELKNFAITVEYFSDSETITFKDNTHQKMVRIGSVMLTKWGAELIRVCEPGEEVPEFLQRALKVMLGKSERI